MSGSSRLQAIAPYALFAIAAVLLCLPAMLEAPFTHDSFWIDRVWSEQFTAALRSGTLYPRRLPLSFGSLGAPVFYFYAPLSFHLAGLFGLLGLATYPALLAAFAAAWFVSGAAMHAWLKGSARHPVAGAILYMVLPYHVIDFYARGALAESCAAALVPLVAIGVRQAVVKRRALPLALAYAAMIMTHLPTAVITGVLLIAPQAAWDARGAWRRLWPVLLGAAGGVGGAAIYLVPALTLQRHASLGELWSVAFLQPISWSLLHPELWSSKSYVLLFAGIALVTGVAALVVAGKRRTFWPTWTVGVCIVVTGLLPGFWSLPVLSAVQFPWRALVLAEFGLATAIAGFGGSPVLATAVITPLLSLSVLMASHRDPLNSEPMHPLPVPHHQEVIEYLPRGAVMAGRTPDLVAIREAVQAKVRTPGSVFPFPSLRARCGDGETVPLRPDPVARLIVAPPPGCTLETVTLPAEWIGLIISLLTWLGLALAWGRKRLSARG